MRQPARQKDADAPELRPIEGRGLVELTAASVPEAGTGLARKIRQRGISRLHCPCTRQWWRGKIRI